MKSAVFYGKKDLKIENKDIPCAKNGEVVIAVRACGVCGTDMHIFDGDEGAAPTPAGTVLGHEFAGEIVSVGEDVTGFKAGDKVCVDPNKLCNECDYCRAGIGHFCEKMIGIGTTVDGGFSEYCAVPVSQVYKFSNKISFIEAAMTEPVACCLHGIEMCDIEAGGDVAVIGGGMIGLIMLQLALIKGASRVAVIEPIAKKRELAMKMGASLVIDPFTENVSEVLNANGIKRLCSVIECVGKTATVEQAISIAGKHSTVMMFGLTAPADTVSIKPFEIFKKEIILKASFINPYTQARALSLIESGRVDVKSLIYKTLSVDELPLILADKSERAKGKYVVTF